MCAVLATVGLMAGCGKDSPETPETPGTDEPTTPPDKPTEPEVTYKVGDYYKKGFVTGIVVSVDETGKHGSLISLDELTAAWSYKHEEPMGSVPSMSGRQNTDAVYEMAGWRENYPGFLWCSNMDVMGLKLWYIPSGVEFTRIYKAYTGLSPETQPDIDSVHRPMTAGKDAEAQKKWFNDILAKHGGKPISDDVYWTSGELSKIMANAFDMSTGNMLEEPNRLGKEKEYRFRAMSDF